jgi:hypothetical protein
MSAATVAAKGRAANERIMTDTCRIYRLGEATLNATTGALTEAETEIYNGKCRVRPVPSHRTGGELVGESVVARQAPIVAIPFSQTNVEPGDRIQVTASSDAALLTKRYLVQAVHIGTHATARRLICEALS